MLVVSVCSLIMVILFGFMNIFMVKKGVSLLIFCYLPVLAVQIISGLATKGSINSWYYALNKSELNPPDWIFGPVWTLLYILMAVSLWLVWRTSYSRKKKVVATAVFLLQLVLNGLWTPLFFRWHLTIWSLVDLGALFIVVALLVFLFFRLSRLAGIILLPYLFWLGFAFYLNASIVWLN